jgi:PAS domain S-box-containing protein
VEQSPVSILITDPEYAIEYVNPMFTEMSEYIAEEAIGNSPNILNSEKITFETMCTISERITEGQHWSGELLNKKKNGELYWVSSSISPIKDKNGKVTHFIGINDDITEQKLLQQQRDEAHNVIKSSIQYASRIQRSILPSAEMMNTLLPNYFVCWEPRDIVGGDIYWCRPWGEGVVTILGDCTGHGVPGAFMTLISYGALVQALTTVKPGDAASLISAIHVIIQESLGQDEDYGDSDDGLELGVCYLPKENKSMTFAGARFSLFYQDEKTDAIEIKGDKKGVGYRNIPKETMFTNQSVEIIPERRFIMTTDGMIDQIGGEKRRGFGKKRFVNLLNELQGSPMQEVGIGLYTALTEYQGDESRRDDVSMMGFSF